MRVACFQINFHSQIHRRRADCCSVLVPNLAEGRTNCERPRFRCSPDDAAQRRDQNHALAEAVAASAAPPPRRVQSLLVVTKSSRRSSWRISRTPLPRPHIQNGDQNNDYKSAAPQNDAPTARRSRSGWSVAKRPGAAGPAAGRTQTRLHFADHADRVHHPANVSRSDRVGRIVSGGGLLGLERHGCWCVTNE